MKIRTIELLRGLAALSVAVAHCDSMFGGNPALPFGRWHSFSMPGTAGVEFFFVLSGFVMAVAHRTDLAQGGHIGRFLWKRCCRIYPLYWVVFAFPLYRYWGAPLITPDALFAWLSLLPIRTDTLLVVAWTLRQEMTFYLVLAVCLLPLVGRYVLVAWVAGTIAIWFVAPQPPTFAGVPGIVFSHVFSIFNFEFFAGLLAGWVLPLWIRRHGLAWAVLAVGVAGLAWRMALDNWGAEYGPVYARAIYGAAYGAIILGCAVLERSGRLSCNARLASIAGMMSYPLYLSHLLTIDAVVDWIGPSGMAARLGPDLTFIALLTPPLLVAAVLAWAVDRPVQRLLRRISAGSSARRPALG